MIDRPMTKETLVLDHGYVRLVEHWGSDQRIIEAARMSTDGAFRGWGHECEVCAGNSMAADDNLEPTPCPNPSCDGGTVHGDERLLSYLYKNKHATPFEFAGAVFEVQAPIFVFREWHRHRSQSYNEMSARYIEMPDLYYVPPTHRMTPSEGRNRQSRGRDVDSVSSEKAVNENRLRMVRLYEQSRYAYETLLRTGVPREVARCVLPLAQYSRMRASTNLRCWLMFLTLRQAKNAQWEIRQYADAVGEILEKLFPRTWALYAANGKQSASR